MPFAALDSPSLALGLFKSRLRESGIPCDVEHLNLRFAETIGWDSYEILLRLSAIFAGERLFAMPLFGSQLPPDGEYYSEILLRQAAPPDVPQRLEAIRRYVPPFLDHCVESIPWGRYDVVGFTSMFEQNLPSLVLAALVKQRWPHIRIVFGGANCEDIMGITLHRCFPFVDFVFTGESDDSFLELLKRLAYGHPPRDLRGVVWRENGRSVFGGPASPRESFEDLPVPDYDDYFERIEMSPLRMNIRPSILMESARGCWWGERSHCTFCGLNGLTMRFRAKSAHRTLYELRSLVERHPAARCVRFVDNIMAPSHFKTLLPELAKLGLEHDVLFEVKANLKKYQVKAMASAGLTVQAGIESLSTKTLKLMGKGSNALMNIQTLKWCRQYGVLADWNLLYGFPGEDADDYRRTLELASVLTHLDPPTGFGPIRLDRFSPNFNHAREKGLVRVRPMSWYRYLYPFDEATLASLVYYFDFDYAAPIDTGGLLPAIEQVIRRWQGRGERLYVEPTGEGLVIHDSRRSAEHADVRLTGLAARIYEFCDKARGLGQILEMCRQFGAAEEGEVGSTLRELLRRRLMVEEDDRYLSLAVMSYESVFDKREAPVAQEWTPVARNAPVPVAPATPV